VAVLGLVVAVGLVATVVEAFWSLPDKLADALLRASGTDAVATDLTGWYAAAAVGALLSVAASAAAVVLVPRWPEMGTRYDAPTGASAAEADRAEPKENIDIWKALDEGRDPTGTQAQIRRRSTPPWLLATATPPLLGPRCRSRCSASWWAASPCSRSRPR
jgi:uncharacterized membrane protein (TIGR02234 family)